MISRPSRRNIRKHRRLCISALGLLLAGLCASSALDIRRVHTCSGLVLQLRGPIEDGDFSRLASHFQGDGEIVGFDMSSDGGDLEEGLRIAELAHREKLTVFVASECDSACADVFVAASKRYVARDARIGVHAVSNERDLEDRASRALTLDLARLWAERGAPSSAIDKMLGTRPDAIAYLDRADLSALAATEGYPFSRLPVGRHEGARNAVRGCNP